MNKENKSCCVCQSTKPKMKSWIEEKQFLGNNGQILKEVYIGGFTDKEIEGEPINTVYYCSNRCMEKQMDKEEEELWKKGDCQSCNKPLAVINDNCQDLEHKKLGCLFPIGNLECSKHKN